MTDNTGSRAAVFAGHVRRLREERDWSQAELGRRLAGAGQPLGQSRIAAIEAAGSVTIDQAAAFAQVFGVPIEAMLYEHSPATEAVQIQQIQQLLRIGDTVSKLSDEVWRLIREMHLPVRPGIGTITTDSFTRKEEGPDGQHQETA